MNSSNALTICIRCIVCGLLSLLLVSCARDNFDKIPQTTFIKHYVHDKENRTPFLSYWEDGNTNEWNSRVEGKHGQKQVLYVKAINTAYMTPQPEDADEKKDLETLKSYFRSSLTKYLKKAIKSSENFVVSAHPSSQAYTLEIAITSITPSKPLANIVTSGLGMGKKVVSPVAKALIPKGQISIAAKLQDRHGRTIAEMADYEEDKSALLIDFKNFTRYGHHKAEIDGWCEEFTKLLTQPADFTLKRRKFSLNPF